MITRKYEPDFNQLLKVLRREKADRPVLFEYFTNGPMNEFLAGRTVTDPTNPEESVRLIIDAFTNAGYDYVSLPSRYYGAMRFTIADHAQKSTVSQNDSFLITDRATFNSYPWPDPEKGDFNLLNRVAPFLKTNMKFVAPGPGGVLENVIDLVGFERLCYLLFDDEQLTQDIFDGVGARLLRFYEIVSGLEPVGALIVNDDWGFKTQTMLDPDSMYRYVFPWHKKIVDAIHLNGKPAILHSCGNLETVMDYLIDELGYDAKHSWEDAICPVETAWQRWGSRIAILGGIDMDFLVRGTPEAIHQRADNLLNMTGSKSYALGSGNSIPAFVPVENYLAMIGAAKEID
ncbi:MAG: uroporphyrinogen decarboxylase family protein [Mariniphaga sp.]